MEGRKEGRGDGRGSESVKDRRTDDERCAQILKLLKFFIGKQVQY